MSSNNIITRPPLSCITELTVQSNKPQEHTIRSILLEEYPHLLRPEVGESNNNIQPSRVRQLMDFIEEDDIAIINEFSKVKMKKRNSLIQHITYVWDYKYAIRSYNNGELTVEDMCKYFFFNESNYSIQTVIIKNYVREIITITDELDCKDQLDHYKNVFMRKNAPKGTLDNGNYLIVDEYYSQSVSDDILQYIRSNVIVTCNDIKLYYNDFASEKKLSYKAFVDNLNKLCYDISYKSTNLPNKGEIPIGSYLKATYLVDNKQSIVYVYYNGIVPDNVKIPRLVRLEQLQE